MITGAITELENMNTWILSGDGTTGIILNVVASFLFLALLQFFGVFSRIRLMIKHRLGMHNYRKKIRQDCESLIVIGQNQSLSIGEVFIPLDLSRSALSAGTPHTISGHVPPRNCVILGGPGAGKSTLVKHWVLKVLEVERRFVIFIRLRDYTGTESIEAYAADQLNRFRVPRAAEFLFNQLSQGNCFCVLDGLDEVRPQQRSVVIAQINTFYSKYFKKIEPDYRRLQERGRLIVSCRKEAYRDVPLDINEVWEVRPLDDDQIKHFVEKWPRAYPKGKDKETFLRDLHATTQILELARSPLLLVGGLMQYIESNLGIPEQRFEYLQRVARWLIIDWATAQGHPPDPNRPAYDRILPKLALHMHESESAEITLIEARDIIKKWLPDLGYSPDIADEIISSIAQKTGILHRDTDRILVFAQFGLQEYFASLEAMNRLAVDGIVAHASNPWWREVILLCAAQQREPGALLTSLLDAEPLLGVAALAECATPPLDLQERAVNESLAALDRRDPAVSGALIPLLRRTTGSVEARLGEQLEARLSGDPEISVLVGSILATAGTDVSTEVLSRHPGIWDQTLAQASFFSANFERLLLQWVEGGNDTQGEKAVELLVSRLSASTLRNLIAALPKLSPERAEFVAILLIEYAAAARGRGDRIVKNDLGVFANCAPYVKDPEKYFARVLAKQTELEKRFSDVDRRYPVALPPELHLRFFWSSLGQDVSALAGAGPTSLLISTKNQRNPQRYLHHTLSKAWNFQQGAGALICTAATGLLLIATSHFEAAPQPEFLILSILLFITGFTILQPLNPWKGPYSSEDTRPMGVLIAIIIGGVWATVTLASFGWGPGGSKVPSEQLPIILASLLALLFGVGSVMTYLIHEQLSRREFLDGVDSPWKQLIGFVESGAAATIFGVIVTLLAIGFAYWGWNIPIFKVFMFMGSLLLACAVTIFCILALSWRTVKRASIKASTRIELYVKNSNESAATH